MTSRRRHLIAGIIGALVAGFGLGAVQPVETAQACTRKSDFDDCGCYCDDGDEMVSCKTFKTGQGCFRGCLHGKSCEQPPPDDNGGGDNGGGDNGGGDSGGDNGGIWT